MRRWLKCSIAPALTPDTGKEVLNLTTDGQQVGVAHAFFVVGRPSLGTDGWRRIPKLLLTQFGCTLKAGS